MRTTQKYITLLILLVSPVFFTAFAPQRILTNSEILTSTIWQSVGLASLKSVVQKENVGIRFQFLDSGEMIVTDQSNNATKGLWSVDDAEQTITFSSTDPSNPAFSFNSIDNTSITCPISKLTSTNFNFRLPILDPSIPDSIQSQLKGYNFELRLVPLTPR